MSANSRKSSHSQGNGTLTNGVARNGAHPEARRSNSSRPKWPSQHSKRQRLAVLRNSAEDTADIVEVAYHSPQVGIVLKAGGSELFRGSWEATVAVDGHSHSLAGPWELGLWHADADCDYLEITCRGPNGLRVDRQILLSRTDRFTLLADVVTHPSAKRIDYAARWGLAKGLTGQRPGKTRELRLGRGRRSLARIFPVGLPQEVVQGRTGSLSSGEGSLELHQSMDGCGLFVPLVIDWHGERRTVPADWRGLTVTEEEKIVRADQASGYRLRMGTYQLLLYRSLQATSDTRCLLGYHTRFETAIGQFLPTGDVRQIMATVSDDK